MTIFHHLVYQYFTKQKCLFTASAFLQKMDISLKDCVFSCDLLMAERQHCVFENTQPNELNRHFCSSLGFGFIWFFLFFFKDIFSINCDFILQKETVASGKGEKSYLYFSSYMPGLQIHSVHQLKSVLTGILGNANPDRNRKYIYK